MLIEDLVPLIMGIFYNELCIYTFEQRLFNAFHASNRKQAADLWGEGLYRKQSVRISPPFAMNFPLLILVNSLNSPSKIQFIISQERTLQMLIIISHRWFSSTKEIKKLNKCFPRQSNFQMLCFIPSLMGKASNNFHFLKFFLLLFRNSSKCT